MEALATQLIELLRAEVDAALERRLSVSQVMSTRLPVSVMSEAVREQVQQFQIISHKPYLDKREVAVYLSCSERSVDEWAARPGSENPLPVGYVGSHMRVKREKIDQWVEREAQRKRLKLAS